MLVLVQLSTPGLYLPPVFKKPPMKPLNPAQTIISLPVQTAVCAVRASGTLVLPVAVQLSVLGLYLPPVLEKNPLKSIPPHTIISLPVHTALCPSLPSGALVVLVAVQLSAPGLYRPPVFTPVLPSFPPQMIISPPVHTAV